MANIKDISRSAAKFVQRASVAGQQYQEGINNPKRSWATATAGADKNYAAGVQAAVSSGRFAAGVKKAGDQKWAENALAKGPARFAEGVAMAQDAWQNGFKPYQAAIASLQLPERGPRGSAGNLARVATVANTLRALKTGGAK